MKLSIGITSYNQHEYVEDTIKSLLNQTMEPYEIVVSENHSSDGSYEIVQKYKDRVKVIRPDQHLSYIDHVNFLINNLSGDWVLLAASDDTYLPNMVEDCCKNMDDESVMISFGFNMIDENNNIKGRRKYKQWIKSRIPFPDNFFINAYHHSIPMWSTIYRSSSLRMIGGYGDEKNVICDHDWVTTLKLSVLGSFKCVPESLICNYRFEYRPDVERLRMENEAKDTSYICNKIVLDIINDMELPMSMFNKIRIANLRNKISLYKKYNVDYEKLFDLFCISKQEASKYGLYDKIIQMYRTKLKRII